ncbi:MAG: adenosylmethionine-8-amino-7-oxononanoate aminotransferase [Limisphaerales bacterium]|nr:MAG: adenosylmethionine-8-amino-7-oxononanoate aminotransferase [Limisphaerales bacterium]KAG0509423.1 MAG: adenosylmethionine-8-amino-7-oxononanoate aminotransferase [Limisphaerales bacterium]TXT52260.1 MAG: adenosylmethionine-8-amino-7-oxononanoate aminotransferase [Limisphaerales bacterium]
MHKLARLDHAHVWHPFTQMRDWLRREPIIITAGQGAVLRDVRGREFLDANSSIWTNLHGHNHPKLNAALKRQLGKIAHSSALGFANEPASLLAAKLVGMAKGESRMANHDTARAAADSQFAIRSSQLSKVFFSDDGSTAMEVALKLAYEFTRRTRGPKAKPRFLSLAGAYHGDTVGAVSLGHIDLFHQAYGGLLFKTDQVMSPYCYRCPFNRAQPERADAREYRKCNWECVDKVEAKCAAARKRGNDYAAFVFEPLMQGAAGMIPQPAGWLKRVTDIARGHGALLVADEVMTGFGRTGGAGEKVGKRESERGAPARQPTFPPAHFLTGSSAAGVQPDFLALAKGLTGGYLPMAATLTTQAVFDAFLGDYEEFKTFFHGHSYTGNQLGAAAALASLDLLAGRASIAARARLEKDLRCELKSLWSLPNVGDVRRVGLVAGVELVRAWRTREPFDLRERAGIRVCEAMARRGVLTRPIGNVVVLMPPYCTTTAQVRRMVEALREAGEEVLGGR